MRCSWLVWLFYALLNCQGHIKGGDCDGMVDRIPAPIHLPKQGLFYIPQHRWDAVVFVIYYCNWSLLGVGTLLGSHTGRQRQLVSRVVTLDCRLGMSLYTFPSGELPEIWLTTPRLGQADRSTTYTVGSCGVTWMEDQVTISTRSGGF